MLPPGSGGSTVPVEPAKHLRLPRGCPPSGTQAANRAGSLPIDNYVTRHVDGYVTYHVCCREKVTGPPGPGHVTTGHREPGHD
jgi:hypothetical protein